MVEGETEGVADAVLTISMDNAREQAGSGKMPTGSTPRPWITAIARQETARKLNVKVEFVKSDKDLGERMHQNGEEKPSLIIFDLNNANVKPLTLIPKLKSKLKKGTSIIGFLSHVQGDLKQKAHEVGCDMVLPRSAFSQNLPQLLRRHGAHEEETPATTQ